MKIVVVGAGPAGIMAAIRASELSPRVVLIEKNPILGKKLLLSGKGRCNLTNTCDLDSFLRRFFHGGQFLRDAFKKFFNTDLIRFFEERGLKLKVERQQRVFPVSDMAGSVVEVLRNELVRNKVRIITGVRVKDILAADKKVKGVLLEDNEFFPADKVILATGGVSYSFTGSTGEGINIARKLGHTIVTFKAGLVPVELKQPYIKYLEGLALKNTRVTISSLLPTGEGRVRVLESPIGELLFTRFGVSGPLILSLSGQIGDWLAQDKKVFIEIDLKPGLSQEQLNGRLLREFKSTPKKRLKNVLKEVLPQRLIEVFVDILKLDAEKNVSHITQNERQNMVFLLKRFRLDVKGLRPIEEGFVTRGGISLKEVNPRTMESRIIKDLYFSGEMLDIDADTGGFNLQAAFSTGYLAGESAVL